MNKEQVSHASHGALWTALVAVVPFIWINFIEPRVVFAEQLEPLKETVSDISNRLLEYNHTNNEMRVELLEMRLENYIERIRATEARGRNRDLTADEYLLLDQYQDQVEKIKRKLSRIGA